ncbi:helix-turn-helix transcriptional regulator [Micromonospora sp. C28SCA-DRY-2]|uniref:helix-turn-helix domain-containing protein n=1 Tax=Micromonospora sp. C28SCA-DRY-2 TaxID=3059522 RepID=UPI0026765EE1|nr:helix-turn-helix transcriptional regulator [Micromonospora sp. C28SCA-DRY-2]MDO3704820.1 helix-turn-helix transcriptional regulator [Micromonospora sp. C28SCA-DRY-2]
MTGPEPGTPGATALGARIQRLRAARGLTQRALAEPRYTAAYVSAVEGGRRVPSADAVAHFAERLGVTPADLATGRSPADVLRLRVRLVRADLAGATGETATVLHGVAAAAAELDEPVVAARARLGLATVALRRDDPDTASAQLDRAEALLAGAPPPVRAEVAAGRAAVAYHTGDPRYARYLLTEARDALTRDGFPDPSALLTLCADLVLCHVALGDGEAAAEAAGQALALAVLPAPARVAELHLTVAESLLAAGGIAEAAVAVEQARQAARQVAMRVQLACCRRARGQGRRAAGDLAGALADLATAHTALTDAGQRALAREAGVDLAEVYHALGQPEHAEALLRDAADPGGDVAVAARADRVRGLLRADAGDQAAAERHLRAAAAGFRAAGWRRELAAVVLLLADRLERWGRPGDALDLLRDGLHQVEQLGERVTGSRATA